MTLRDLGDRTELLRKREAEMLASEKAAMQQEELVRIILSKHLCQNVENIFL